MEPFTSDDPKLWNKLIELPIKKKRNTGYLLLKNVVSTAVLRRTKNMTTEVSSQEKERERESDATKRSSERASQRIVADLFFFFPFKSIFFPPLRTELVSSIYHL